MQAASSRSLGEPASRAQTRAGPHHVCLVLLQQLLPVCCQLAHTLLLNQLRGLKAGGPAPAAAARSNNSS
jgi:hypothetical protein